VVDDNQSNLANLEGMVGEVDACVHKVDSAEAALIELRRAQNEGAAYELLIVDSEMPGMDGFALVERIQRRPDMLRPAIVMLTAIELAANAARCKELGVAFLVKPIAAAQLQEAMTKVLKKMDRERNEMIRPVSSRPPVQAVLKPSKPAEFVLRVLIAEDNPINQRVLSEMMRKAGFEVYVANNGQAAVQADEDREFDVILMDVQMPQMDGIQATEHIRRREQSLGRRIPIIAVTANARKEDRDMCLKAGMDEFTTKPIRSEYLLAVVRKLVQGHAKPSAGDVDLADAPVHG
jgi:CheY-like chemotaxis protein